ncbi:toxic anion resistance protein (plasmid) [Dyella sp. BiH032]|uniref:toxic anion resistance protein n=1 Tax=Dyella sp. BiH032 TaxID=3075430 RepID=UPI002893374D|nr:toxic anion resistance protein [Dyella sp. BiH032]WNL48355.1 toxic anion resistance protein [Dyella sp. BiH032]
MNDVVIAADPKELKELGLRAEDLPAVQQLKASIDASSPAAVSGFGLEIGKHTSSFTDSILAQVRSKDLDNAGELLNELASAAGKANFTALGGSRSKLPVIGSLIDRFTNAKDKAIARFNTVEEQVNKLAAQVDTTEQTLNRRIHDMDAMAISVRDEYRLIGQHILAGKQKLKQLQQDYDALPEAANPEEAMAQSEAKTVIQVLDKRIADMLVLQHSNLQQLPMIRMLQDNDAQLLDKFSSAKTITIPNFKRQFVLRVALEDQKRAVDFAERIDETNNQLLRDNAKLLQRNTIRAAEANQRLAIDVDTLQAVQDDLVKTYADVRRIQDEGQRNRAQVEEKVRLLKQSVQAQLGRPVDTDPARRISNDRAGAA